MLDRIPDRNIWLVYAAILLLGTAYGISLALTALFLAARGFVKEDIGSLAAWLAFGVAFFADGQADLPGMVGLLWILAAAIWMVRGRTPKAGVVPAAPDGAGAVAGAGGASGCGAMSCGGPASPTLACVPM